MGKESQYKAIMEKEPFTTIQITGTHSQLNLGEYKGIPYVFDTHGYGYKEEDGKKLSSGEVVSIHLNYQITC